MPYLNKEISTYKDQKDLILGDATAMIASDASMFEHSKKSRVQSAARSTHSRDRSKALPKGILITSKNRSTRPPNWKPSHTYSKASGVSYAVKEINSHEKE